MINVLQILPGSKDYNGISNFLLSYYENMDRSTIHFDFLFCRENSMKSRENEPFLCSSKFFVLNAAVSGKLIDSLKLINSIKKVIDEGNYDIIHINTGSIYITTCCVYAASLAHAPYIVAHSHNADPSSIRVRNKTNRIKNDCLNLMRQFIIRKCDLLFACSNKAGTYLFGDNIIRNKKYHLIRNAIYVDDYIFDPTIRTAMRSKLGILDETNVLGCVGRLAVQKNHLFLVDVFHEYKKLDPGSVLLLVGDGEEKDRIEEKIKTIGLTNSVRFLGQRKDVNRVLQAIDAFVMTSFFEGLSVATIEAQASGLPLFLSDEISYETDISGLVQFLSLNVDAKEWAENIFSVLSRKNKRVNMKEIIQNSGYDICQAGKELEGIYLNLSK